ncbi:MAG: hypothetical protein ACR2NS_08440 [Gemmatimonadaceae bacterium]
MAAHSPILTRAPLALLAGFLGCMHQVTQESAVRAVNPILAQGVNITASIAFDREGSDFVRARAFVANSGDHPVRLHVGSCPLVVRAYTRPEASGSPAWSSLDRPRVCKAFRHAIELGSGESQTLEAIFLVRTIQGDKLREGQYTFTVSVRFLDPEFTTPEYAAGQLALSR